MDRNSKIITWQVYSFIIIKPLSSIYQLFTNFDESYQKRGGEFKRYLKDDYSIFNKYKIKYFYLLKQWWNQKSNCLSPRSVENQLNFQTLKVKKFINNYRKPNLNSILSWIVCRYTKESMSSKNIFPSF